MSTTEFVRTKKGCFKPATSRVWGSYYTPIEDPEALEDIDLSFQLHHDLPHIPALLWERVIKLFERYLVKNTNKVDSSQEAQVLLLLSEDFSTWKIVVPEQTVNSASVHSSYEPCIDIETGEVYDTFPPVGWLHAGDAH